MEHFEKTETMLYIKFIRQKRSKTEENELNVLLPK